MIIIEKVIVSVAPVLAENAPDLNDLAEDIKKCVKAGAAICHLHSRTESGELTPDISYLEKSFDKILEKTDIVVQVSTGGISQMSVEERSKPLNYEKAETASLNGGSINLGDHIYKNSYQDIKYFADKVYEKNIIPEIEVFDISMINNIQMLKQECKFREPILYNLVFGHSGGIQANLKSLYTFQSFIPKTALWGVTHYGRDNWTFLAAAVAMGASLVRIGFEDSDYLSEKGKAQKNYQLVKKIVEIIESMGLKAASPAETREILRIEKIKYCK